MPAAQSSSVADSAGACETPVGLRTNSIAVGHVRGQHTGVVPGAGRQDRRGRQYRADPFDQLGVERPSRATSTRRATATRGAVAVGPLGSLRADRLDQPGERRLVGRPGVEPCRSPTTGSRWSRSGPPGSGRWSRARRTAGPPCSPPARCTRTSASGRAGRPSGSYRRGCPRRRSRAASARAARSRSRCRPATIDERAALFDVQFDEGFDAGERGPDRHRPRPSRGRPGSSRRPASRRRGRAAPVPFGGDVAPVSSRDPRQARPNREPSSSVNTAIRIGLTGVDAAGPHLVDRRAARDTTPSGPSYAPPCGTESRWLPVTIAFVARRRRRRAARSPRCCRCRRPRRRGRGRAPPR